MKTSYGERDSAFGQAMLTLRTTTGLTRGELANRLGVSRQAVGEWEAGRSYPKAEHLKAFIALAVEHQAFPAEHEAEEIRKLWKMARQKVLLDEFWLSALLDQQRAPHLWTGASPVPTAPVRGARMGESPAPVRGPAPVVPEGETKSDTSVISRSTLGARVDWGDALAIPIFYGREEELALLSQWVVREHCRLVSVLGMGGIGKSALAVSMMYRLAEHFEVVIFRSLRDAPSCEELLDDCLQVLSLQPLRVMPLDLERRISLLLTHLRQARTLLVLDNLECLLEDGDIKGHLRPDFEGYEQLLHLVVERDHQSCLLLTSREKPAELRPLEGRYPLIRSLRLTGLDVTACKHLLVEKEVVGEEREQESLIEVYGGNPLALKMVSETIVDLFGGEIGEFLAGGTVIFGSIADLLDEQFARLSALEQTILYWLAIVREPVTIDELQALLVTPLSSVQMLGAIDGLRRRSLIERGKRPGSFTLQSVVLEYVTAVLIARASSEIQQHQLDRLIEHGLEQAHAKEYVRQTQERLLISPLLASLQSVYPIRADVVTGGFTPVEEQLLCLLDGLRKESDDAQGYGPTNLIALLRLKRGHLSGLDLSQLCIRGAYLQSIKMQDASLAGAQMRDAAFAEAVSATGAVAISPDGRLGAASGMQGKVRVWEERGQTLRLIWQAHTGEVQALAFSPDGHTLASGSTDGTVKLWDVESGTLLWMGWQNAPRSLAFSPDGSLLASGGTDATVRLWDPQSGTNLQTLSHPGHVVAVAFSPDGSLLASGGFYGEIRLWQRQQTASTPCIEVLSIQTNWVTGLAFAPDGKTLASANWDQTVKLWEVPSGNLLHALPGQTSKVNHVAWSPDGHTLASCGSGATIWLWDVEQGSYRATLHGHTADINDMAFTPDSSCLLSGSADSTLRIWDVKTGQCVRIIQGYAVSLYDIDWSPDGTQLVSGGSDALVTIWDLSRERSPRELHGHTWVVWGVGWSPDGRFLASGGLDRVMRLWDSVSGACVQMFQAPSAVLLGMAWSPDGSLLACGTYEQGVQVWDVAARSLRWAEQTHLILFHPVAWSPQGTRLVGGGDDGCVYVWEGADGTLLQRLPGHQGRVMSVVWSPNGTWVASGSGSEGSGELFVWDVESGERVRTFTGHPGVVYALAWSHSRTGTRHSPYRDRLISGDSDGMLRWWDVQTGECVCMRAAHQGKIQALRMSPDGKKLASCGDDGTIMIWDLESAECVQTLQRDRPYERLNITGIRGLTEAQRASLRALGAIDEAAPQIEERLNVEL